LGVLALPYEGIQAPLVAHSRVVGLENSVDAYFTFEDQQRDGVQVTIDVRSGLNNVSMVSICYML
jgi:hypothetical protein